MPAGGQGDEQRPGPDRGPGHPPLGGRRVDRRGDPEADPRRATAMRTIRLAMALSSSGSPVGRSSAVESTAPWAARDEEARGKEQGDQPGASPARSASARASRGSRRGRCGRTRCGAPPRTRPRCRAPPTTAAIPGVVELARTGRGHSDGLLLGVGKALNVQEDADARSRECRTHLAHHEQHQQGEGEERGHQFVGDRPRHPGDVLLVGAVPERAPPRSAAAPPLTLFRFAPIQRQNLIRPCVTPAPVEV